MDDPARPTTMTPAAPEARVETPAGLGAARTPTSDPPLHALSATDRFVAIEDLRTRRSTRAVASVCITLLWLGGMAFNRPIPGWLVATIATLGLGSQGLFDAWKRKRGPTGLLTLALLLGALGADALGVPALGHVSVLGAAVWGFAIDRLRLDGGAS